MTSEFKKIIQSYKQAKAKNIRAVMATVVDVNGSSYRRPGVGMLILENNQMVGAVSGGCVEKEVLRQSQSVFSAKKAKMMTYNGRYRLGCEGVLYILLEPLEISNNTIDILEECLKSRIPFSIKSYYSKSEDFSGTMGSILSFSKKQEFKFTKELDINAKQRDLDVFDRQIPPCFRLIIIGSEHDAIPLCAMAHATGWEVTIVDGSLSSKTLIDFPGAHEIRYHSPDNLVLERVDAHTAIIIMTHNFAKDVLYLKAICNTSPVYIGLLGPSNRREKLLSAFIEYFPNISEEFLECIYGPSGLNIGAETPQEIAISIIAEILAVVRHQKPISLQDKLGGIHSNLEREMIDSSVNN